jgi:hypothetical protein
MEHFDLSIVFSTEASKNKFLKFINRGISPSGRVEMSEIEDMLEDGDTDTFLSYLDDQPIYRATWGALWHAGSGEMELYYYDGMFIKGDDDGSYCYFGPYNSASEAFDEIGGSWCQLEYSRDIGSSQIVSYSSEVSASGRKLISDSLADSLFDQISGLSGAMTHKKGKAKKLVWFNVEPDRLFNDLYHDKVGKAISSMLHADMNDLEKAENNKSIQALLKKGGYVRKDIDYDDLDLSAVSVSTIVRVDFGTRKSLNHFVGKWVRICPVSRSKSKCTVYIKEIVMPDNLIKNLVPINNF